MVDNCETDPGHGGGGAPEMPKKRSDGREGKDHARFPTVNFEREEKIEPHADLKKKTDPYRLRRDTDLNRAQARPGGLV